MFIKLSKTLVVNSEHILSVELLHTESGDILKATTSCLAVTLINGTRILITDWSYVHSILIHTKHKITVVSDAKSILEAV